MNKKICSTCKQTLELSKFNKEERRPDGYANRCRSCTKIYVNARNNLTKERNLKNFGAEVPSSKLCYKCKTVLPIQNFSKNVWKSDQHNEVCKACANKWHKDYYKENKGAIQQKSKNWAEKHRKSIRLRNGKNRALRRGVLNNFKKLNGCHFCGEVNPIVLDLHHLDPNIKKREVSRLLGGNQEKMWEEVDKCIVICSNCHRRLHAGELTYKA